MDQAHVVQGGSSRPGITALHLQTLFETVLGGIQLILPQEDGAQIIEVFTDLKRIRQSPVDAQGHSDVENGFAELSGGLIQNAEVVKYLGQTSLIVEVFVDPLRFDITISGLL
ncbi:MAG: Uncharacterised protein [Flavobacteriia bacterium]|nr:MAG: Uncharacterised protein [Flavobacteriia bacterium]